MRTKRTLLSALFIFALGCFPHSRASSQHKKSDTEPSPQARAMKGLRDKLLTASAAEVGLSGEDAEAKVWGVVMEVAFPNGVATIVSVRDGTASLYMSTGGGVLGGYVARNQAKRFVAEAEKHLASMKPTKSFPYPEVGRLKFYVLTRDGVYSVQADEKEVVRGRHSLSPLFVAANEVLTALRTSTGPAKPD